MKTLKQLREEYDIVPQVTPEELVLEGKLSPIPSPSEMPNLLMFRRVTYRMYPNRQVVALYYSKTVDKYLSIPFGPTGNLNLSEATIYDTLEELDLNEGAKWQAVKGGVKGAIQGGMKGFYVGNAIASAPGVAVGTPVGAAIGAYKGAKKAYNKAKEQEKDMNEDWSDVKHQNPSGGLKKSGVMAYRREHPGSKLQTAVTTKPSKLKPGSKAANRRKSFCARMGGMKKRLTSAKTANDPDSRINKSLRKWNCEEAFKQKLYEKRMQQEGIVGDTIEKGRQWAQDKVKGSKTFKAIQDFGHTLPGYENVKASKEKFSKGDYWGGAKEAGKSVVKAVGTGAAVAGAVGATALGLKGLSGLGGAGGDGDKKSSSVFDDASKRIEAPITKTKAKVYTPKLSARDSAVDDARRNSLMRKEYESSKKQTNENKISDLKKMIDEGAKLHDININGRTITLNSSMAKRIVEVYDSVNTKNKKIVEGMLNEDLESFKRLLNFSIKA